MTSDAQALAGIVLITCWIVFLAVWLVSAFFTKRTAFRQDLVGSVAYRVLAVAGFFLLVRGARFSPALGLRFAPPSTGLAWLAAACGIIGLGICLWARLTLGRNWSSVVTVKENHELVQHGPYRFVRHPIYTGILTLFTGNVLLDGRWGGILGDLLLLLSFWIKLRHEEALMLKEFPRDYPAYMQRVRRLVPYVF